MNAQLASTGAGGEITERLKGTAALATTLAERGVTFNRYARLRFFFLSAIFPAHKDYVRSDTQLLQLSFFFSSPIV